MTRLRDHHVRWALSPLAAAAIGLPLSIAAMVAARSSLALSELSPGPFLLDDRWSPSAGRWLVLQMLAATAASSAGALALAAPIALGLALHLRLFASGRTAALVRLALGVLAGVPSVVYGLVALQTLVPAIRAVHPPGLSLLAAILTLAVMILPTLALASDSALHAVPAAPVRAAAALGLGPADTARAVLLPLAAPGLRTAGIVALARALGETMALLMVAGNAVAWPTSLFAPVRTLTGGIAVEMAYASGVHRSALFVCGLLLLALASALTLAGAARR